MIFLTTLQNSSLAVQRPSAGSHRIKKGEGGLSYLLLLLLLSACTPHIPPDALQLTQENLELRQLQSRRFDTKDEGALLAAGAAVLQDLGFSIDASESKLGVIVASKHQSAYNAAEITLSTTLLVMSAISGSPILMPVDKEQKVRVAFVTRLAGQDGDKIIARVTFQRVVWNTQGKVTKSELLKDAELYQAFFEKLAKGVFLQAHEF